MIRPIDTQRCHRVLLAALPPKTLAVSCRPPSMNSQIRLPIAIEYSSTTQ